MEKVINILLKIRNSKLKKLIIFILSFVILFLVFKNQENWFVKNCTNVDASPSCKYIWQRLYLLPISVFILFYIIIWIDIIILFIKKVDTKLDMMNYKNSFIHTK